MARTGRPPKPLELHRRHGTYRPDRHGPKLPVVQAPAVLVVVEPDEAGNDLYCGACRGRLRLEVLDNRTWRAQHDEDTTCEGTR